MTKKIFLLNLFLAISLITNAQKKQTTKVVADKMSKLPLEKVNIYNEKDNSVSNEEGVFSFISEINELNFSLIGYENLKINFEEAQKQDTIFIEPKSIELNEVVIGNEFAIIKKVYDKIKDNYALQPYNENFFLRCILKRDAEMVRLQDVYGKASRKAVFKTDKEPDNKCEVEVLNMRKIGISEKKNIEYFKFQSFEELFDIFAMINLAIDKFEFTQEKNTPEGYIKISFINKEDSAIGLNKGGYFIINKQDYAIVETCYFLDNNIDNIPYKKNGKLKYRTITYKRTTTFKKNNVVGKYYLNNAYADFRVELEEEEKKEKAFYDCSIVFFVTNSFINDKADSNVSMNKDLFKIKYPFSEQFWKSQNQLPLTNELKDFLKRVSENKDNKKEFEVIGNF